MLFCWGEVFGFWRESVKVLCSNCGWKKSAMDKECIASYIQEHGDVTVRYQQYGKEQQTESIPSADKSDVYGQKQKNRDEVQKIWYELPLSEFFLLYQKESAAFF